MITYITILFAFSRFPGSEPLNMQVKPANNMINPAIKLIILLFLLKNPITDWLHCAEIIEKANRGRAIPIPKNMKLNRFVIKPIVDVLIANKTMRDAGLQGKTIAPKKNPNIKEENKGFLTAGVLICLNNLEKSKLNIRNKLTTAKIPKAIGEIIPIALVKEACKNFVNIKPNKNIEDITPRVTINPKRIKVFFDSLPENWFDRQAKKAGYNGRTQTAAKGAKSPARKDI